MYSYKMQTLHLFVFILNTNSGLLPPNNLLMFICVTSKRKQ